MGPHSLPSTSVQIRKTYFSGQMQPHGEQLGGGGASGGRRRCILWGNTWIAELDLISSPTHPWAGTSVQHPNHITCVTTEFLPFPYFSVMSPQASILLLPASCLPPPSPPICFTQGVPARLPPLHLSLVTSQSLSKMSSSTSLGYSASLFPIHTMR